MQQPSNPSSMNQPYQQRGMQQQPSNMPQQGPGYMQSSWGNQSYNEPQNMRDPHPTYYYQETVYDSAQPSPSNSSSRQNQGSGSNNSRGNSQQRGNQNPGYTADTGRTNHKLTEAELLSQLNEQGKAQYNSLDAEGKSLALQLANADCKGKNSCKGLGSCANEQHSCAGKNGCAGQSSCKFTDKNKAVKVAAMKMAEKRSKLNTR